MTAPNPKMEDVIEPLIAEIKSELKELDLFDDINEGESVYEGQGTIAWVIPGPDNIETSATRTLMHRITIFTIILCSKSGVTPADLRKEVGNPVFDKMMEDITHNGKCWSCLPRLWHPGHVQFEQQTYIGLLGIWEARIFQGYTA